jgi:hypothetical protein
MSSSAGGDPIRFMDCHCHVGSFEGMEEPHFTEVEDLLAEMKHLGISDALVTHRWASRWSPRLGNEKLEEIIAPYANLYPCYVALPPTTGEIAPPAEFARAVRANHGAVRVCPSDHQWRLTDWCAGELLDALEAESIPVLVAMQQTSWDDIAGTLERHAGLSIIVLDTSYRINRSIYPLFARYPTLRLEIHSYQIPWGIEDVTERFGPERLVFGTGLPESDGGGPISQVMYSRLPGEQKALIAGGNLRRMLGIEEEPTR